MVLIVKGGPCRGRFGYLNVGFFYLEREKETMVWRCWGLGEMAILTFDIFLASGGQLAHVRGIMRYAFWGAFTLFASNLCWVCHLWSGIQVERWSTWVKLELIEVSFWFDLNLYLDFNRIRYVCFGGYFFMHSLFHFIIISYFYSTWIYYNNNTTYYKIDVVVWISYITPKWN